MFEFAPKRRDHGRVDATQGEGIPFWFDFLRRLTQPMQQPAQYIGSHSKVVSDAIRRPNCNDHKTITASDRKRIARMEHPGNRGLLWVDAVGGYLLCLGDATVIGQSIPGTAVDVPILGDLSRKHAIIRRSGEGYILEPHAPCTVDRHPCQTAVDLHDGDEILLGRRVELRFRVPHPLSNTARLDMISSHRTQPSVDAILLMGSTCLLGPDRQMHVVCRNWKDAVTLSVSGDGGFRYRTVHRCEIDGRPVAAAGGLGWNERLAGDDFALAIERQ